ncbi:uncharacterized protein C3orf85-like isoform X1 [Hemiscyllium ocellatum]|uniref:uncharacterized protein C3orf85-like isoform X1 n=1 Tax=Hemiscyllium ocellatum TaxID=170820 RepID=UPI0029667EF7|nr:uncharacterized protein C3orf85-like isoform X1 [Hemiscyllium ocellatum]
MRNLSSSIQRGEKTMWFVSLQLSLGALLIHGIAAAPFLTDEEAHHFIRNKRQANTMQGYWDPNSANNVWGVTHAEHASEYWTSLRDTAQYYIGLSSIGFASDPSVVQEHIKSYMDYLRQTSVYLQQQATYK